MNHKLTAAPEPPKAPPKAVRFQSVNLIDDKGKPISCWFWRGCYIDKSKHPTEEAAMKELKRMLPWENLECA